MLAAAWPPAELAAWHRAQTGFAPVNISTPARSVPWLEWHTEQPAIPLVVKTLACGLRWNIFAISP
jgi:hypothetical protein